MKPEQSGYIMPKVLVDVVFKEILVALAKSQVCCVTVLTINFVRAVLLETFVLGPSLMSYFSSRFV